ncbi:MAG: MBL fold metallo-hydrolase, partial [Rhodospirillales bacterium]
MLQPDITAFFDKATSTLSYVVSDPETSACAIIDPLLGYDAASGRTNSTAADEIADFVEGRRLSCVWLLETHVHADHLSGAACLKERLGGQIGIGAGVCEVQRNFVRIFDLEGQVLADGSQFDHLFRDGEMFSVGNISATVMATPGHTPSCVSYLLGGSVFVGDMLFMPDYGTARCDFPGGSARQLYKSIQKVLSLPDETQI